MAALTDVHWETVTPFMRQLLGYIGAQPFSRRFYLAGGTALALRLGHRRSIDLDFFSLQDDVLTATRHEILRALEPFSARAVEDVDGNLLLELPELHIAFLSYGYDLLEPLDQIEGVDVASITDVALMKLDAIIGRGSRKDFYDLYWIAQHVPIASLLDLSRSKYPYARDFQLMAVESLVLFENADRDVQPDLLIDVPWSDVREFFLSYARDLGASWLGQRD